MSISLDCIGEFIFAESSVIKAADVILVPGGSQPQATKKASELYLAGLAPLVLPSGGPNHRLPKDYYTEWQFLKDVAVESGVPEKNGICKENWHKSPEGIALVFGELNKISRYFTDKVHVLTKRPGLSTRTR